MTDQDIYDRVYIARECLSDYLEGRSSLREAERRIAECLNHLDGLMQSIQIERIHRSRED